MSDGANEQALHQQLAALTGRALDAGNGDAPQLEALCADFADWLRGSGMPWATALERQVLGVAKAVKGGKPVEGGWKRLLQALSQAGAGLQAGLDGPSAVGAEAPLPEAPAKAPVEAAASQEGRFRVPPSEEPTFRHFLLEGPEQLQSIETELLSLTQGGAWDPMAVYRPFHTLKGIFGFLNLEGLKDLTHAAEALLEPYKTGQGQPSADAIDLLFDVADSVRLQIQLMAEGIDRGEFELVETAMLRGALQGGLARRPRPRRPARPKRPAPGAVAPPWTAPRTA
jgi:hypothetical protein